MRSSSGACTLDGACAKACERESGTAALAVHSLDNVDRMKGKIYNVGLSDANVSKRELCERIKALVPEFTYLEAPVGKDPDQRNYIVSSAKIEATGFRPAYSLGAGIRELIKGYQMIRNTRYGNV